MKRGFALVLAFGLIAACGGRSELDTGPLVTDGGTSDVDAGPSKLTTSNKLDMLFAIDNSSSMGDKQELLKLAVPAFLSRLTSPWCIPTDPNGIAVPSAGGTCQAGYTIEFPALTDIHLGIVSSSLGGGGSPDVCVVANTDPTHQDDRGHLLNRTDADTPLDDAKPIDGNGGNFLAWVPTSEKPNVTNVPNVSTLIVDFAQLVNGVGQHGCGLEAQLESWYRFLIQPDPWDSLQLSTDNPPKTSLQGVDATVLKMRHDFLRPDSLVLIIQITDEEDSWSDPSWLGGYGWTVRTNDFPGGPGSAAGPRGTSECDQPVDANNPSTTGPNNPDCVSCAFPTNDKPVSGKPISSDPNCQSCAPGSTTCPQKGWYTPATPNVPFTAADGLNVRYQNSMRRRYGLDPQWNIQRYVDGLTSRTVPDRTGEVHDSAQYASTKKSCTNPLFAASLPDGSDTSPGALCDLKDGPRGSSLVYYEIIGGVPWELLAQDPLNTSLPFKRTLNAADWRRIIGTDPAHHVYDGIDPHMIESVGPRTNLEAPTTTYSLGSDPIHGREWNTLTSTAAIDLQYACTFPLGGPKDCTAAANAGSCDCTGVAASAPDGPPLCDPNNRQSQIRGKAYPTIRELRVANGLGNQGVVASICPRPQTPALPDPFFEVLFTRIRTSISK